jgi:initiation factor 1A
MVRTSSSANEKYAIVQKRLGNGWLSVKCIDGVIRLCNIPKKFSGKKKEIIHVDAWLLVGLREFETKKDKCDVLEIYSPQEVASLKKLDENWSVLGVEKEDTFIPTLETGTVSVELDTEVNVDDI